jgi:hypothetical protein
VLKAAGRRLALGHIKQPASVLTQDKFCSRQRGERGSYNLIKDRPNLVVSFSKEQDRFLATFTVKSRLY